jgi:hypothetical protein
VEEADRGGIAAVLAADANLKPGPRGTTALEGDRTSSPTPCSSMVANGERSTIPMSTYCGTIRASMS